MSKNIETNIQTLLNQYDLHILQYINYKNVICQDADGYQYKVNIKNIKSRQQKPHKFRQNPFILNNISNYLKLNKSTLTLVSKQYSNCTHKLEFICDIHASKGVQYKTLNYLIHRNCHCKYCNIENRGKLKVIDIDIVKQKCSELNLQYINSFQADGETKVQFICNKHFYKGIQTICWYHLRTSKYGCSFCAGKNKTTEDFKKEIVLINPNIAIIGEYKGSEHPIKCQCKICGHIWHPIGRSLRYGNGCPSCKCSKGEQKIQIWLNKSNISFVREKIFDDCISERRLRFDFYIPTLNTIIEYDGIQHYRPIDFAGKGHDWAYEEYLSTIKRDLIKNEYCAMHNISIIRIPYWQYDNIETILTQKIFQ